MPFGWKDAQSQDTNKQLECWVNRNECYAIGVFAGAVVVEEIPPGAEEGQGRCHTQQWISVGLGWSSRVQPV